MSGPQGPPGPPGPPSYQSVDDVANRVISYVQSTSPLPSERNQNNISRPSIDILSNNCSAQPCSLSRCWNRQWNPWIPRTPWGSRSPRRRLCERHHQLDAEYVSSSTQSSRNASVCCNRSGFPSLNLATRSRKTLPAVRILNGCH